MNSSLDSFPINPSTWLISIGQLQKFELKTYPVYNGHVTSGFNVSSSDYDNITDLIIGTGVNELNNFGDHTDYLQKTINNAETIFKNLKRIYLLYTVVYFQHKKIESHCELKIIYLDYFLIRSRLTDLSQFSTWDKGDGKAICLPGDVRQRPHKFPVLYHFYNQNKLDRLHYSLTEYLPGDQVLYNDNNFQGVIKILNSGYNKNLNLNSFAKLYKTLCKSFNDGFPNLLPYHGLDQSTYCFPNEWHDASCNLILECCFFDLANYQYYDIDERPTEPEYNKFFFSEKIWKPILSGKPFITTSYKDKIYTQLEDMGFRTFLNYTNIPNKVSYELSDHNLNINKYLEVCYERTLSFLQNISENKDSISNDVMYNQEKWKQLSYSEWENLLANCPPINNLSLAEFCEIFNHCPRLEYFYNWQTR